MTCLPIVFAWTCSISLAVTRAYHVFKVTDTARATYLNLMNEERKRLRLEPLSWSTVYMDRANTYDSMCDNHVGYSPPADKYGQILFRSKTKYSPFNGELAKAAVEHWLTEKNFLDPPFYRCTIRTTTRYTHRCGHYAQILNREASQVGCGEMQCKKNIRVVVCGFDKQLSQTESKKPGT
ncbi:basic form of pathogenesis-related protein 1 [Biomphalaria pfeifferi]|uniref:Basic form of pathogenesis-related protein 1 n=1 Tax=Biomphalaria pfeifferi TaxID=112525 RepID=A0AAD8FAY7_BIOPF|nr:basic form of pathogenesis-related protein 1 [Biomphalaria pfeifferi]